MAHEDDYDDIEEYDDDIEEIDDEFDDVDDKRPIADSANSKRGTVGRLADSLSGPPARPGEQDIVRSPFVLTLIVGTVILLLLGGIFWFMIARESASRRFDAAQEELDQGKYSQAVAQFDDFLKIYPDHSLTPPARMARGRALILREISGSAPAWSPGVERLQDFVNELRDVDGFSEEHENIREYADKIAFGAAESAEVRRDPELVEVSKTAEGFLKRFAPTEGVSQDRLSEIRNAQIAAEAAILQKNVFEAGVAEVEELIAANKTLPALRRRRELIERDETFRARPEIRKLLDDILLADRKLVRVQNVGRDAETDDAEGAASLPFAVTPLTRSSTAARPGTERVYAVAADCCYAVDTETGTAVWKRVIGRDTPFAPIPVASAVPSMLAYDTNDRALVLFAAEDGKLIWRQPIDDAISGVPLVNEGQIYQATRSGNLLKIDVASGRLAVRMQFPQPIVGPPVATSDGRNLVVIGDNSLAYTVTTRPMTCVEVTDVGHDEGAVKTPVMRLSNIYLMADNNRSDSTAIRVLKAKEDGTGLNAVARKLVTGTVHSNMIARGQFLFVPSTTQTITAFSVTEDPQQPPLTLVASQSIQDVPDGPMHLSAGPAGQLWLHSRQLRKFELQADSLKLDPGKAAIGIANQPIQHIGPNLYIARQPEFSQSVYMTRNVGESLQGEWRTILGARILAVSPGNGKLIGVTDTGAVFDVSVDDIAKGGFHEDATTQLQLHEKLATPTGAIALPDGNGIALYAGDPAPAVWIVNQRGQLKQKYPLTDIPQGDAAAIEAGVVVPLPGRLQLVGGRGRTDDYRAPVEQAEDVAWRHLSTFDDSHVIAVTSANRLIKIQYRKGTRAHLAEVSAFEFDSRIDAKPASSSTQIFVADDRQMLNTLSASGLDPVDESKLPGHPTGSLYHSDNRLFVETDSDRVTCFSTSDGPPEQLWSVQTGGGLAGAPLILSGQAVLALEGGRILVIDADGGQTADFDLGQELQSGPIEFDDVIIVIGLDGSLQSIDSRLRGN